MAEKSDATDASHEVVMGITEAAQSLGVSERTIYRRLKSGQLRRVTVSDKAKNVRLKVDNCASNKPQNNEFVTDTKDKVSDTASGANTERILGELCAEIAKRDEQIGQLIESQRELLAANQRLQEQMFELARLVLSQNSSPSSHGNSDAAGRVQDKDKGALPRWLRLLRREEKRKDI